MAKLFILGATSETCKLVQKAEKMGIETYVADPYPEAPSKKFSSHPVLIDCFDIDGICRIMQENSIDGILPGCADILVSAYEQICTKLNKNCYVNKKLVKAFNNKKGLKDILVKHGLPVIEEYSFKEVMSAGFDRYPVFVKPVDNNSSKGMYIANNIKEFERAYNNSLMYSRSRSVLIEACKKCDDFLVGYYACDGAIEAVFTGDRFIIEQDGVGSITSALLYPSVHAGLYFETTHKKMLDIFKDLGFRNGVCLLQGFVENDKIMFYDPALRITGGQEYVILEHIYGFDELKMLIEFAVYGKASTAAAPIVDHDLNGHYACNLAFSVKPGKIGRIDGLDYMRSNKNVINVTQERFAGDIIDHIGTAQQNIFRIHITADTREQLRDVINDLQRHVIAYNDKKENMMLTGFDANLWYSLKDKKL